METPPTRRRRPALSCMECRRRKVKCDRANPCNHCTTQRTICSYKQDLRASSATTPRPVSNVQTPALSGSGASASSDQHYSAAQHPPGHQALSPSSGSGSLCVSQSALRTATSNSTLLDSRYNANSDNLLSVELNAASRVKMKKTRVAGWSDRAGSDLFSSILACYKEASDGDQGFSEDVETRATVVEIGELLQKSKSTARYMKALLTARNTLQPVASLECPSRPVADMAVPLYFDTFESTHRILHAPTFKSDYLRYWTGEHLSDDIRLTILLVIAIGSSLADEAAAQPARNAQIVQVLHTAQSWLAGPFDKTKLSIGALQLHCLLLLARQVLCVGADLVWISAGALLNQALQMGLHRDPSRHKAMTQLQAEIRRRLWATIADLVVQSALDRALPPMISIDDFDVAPPANINDSDLDDSQANHPLRDDTILTDTTIQRLLLKSLPLRLKMAKILNGLNPRLYYPEVLDLSQLLTTACDSSLTSLDKHATTQFRRNLLDYCQRRFLLPLHCLFMNRARSQPLFYYSLKVSLDTASSIAAPPTDATFTRLMTVAGGMFREGIRYTTITFAMEVLAQALAHRSCQKYGAILDPGLCQKLMRDQMELSLNRIRHGETNVKHPMFLTMVMTLAKAIEEGKPSRLMMAQAARDSLREGYDIIKDHKTSMVQGESAVTAIGSSTEASSFDDLEDYDFGFDLDFFMPDATI